jgi:hypothetical protein
VFGTWALGDYTDVVWGEIFILEGYLAYYRWNKCKYKREMAGKASQPFYLDLPCDNDKVYANRRMYADILLEKIQSTFDHQKKEKTNGRAFTINISEEYGYGKTSFLYTLKEKIESQNRGQGANGILIEFTPWLCDTPDMILKEFFQLLAGKLEPYFEHVDDMIGAYLKIFSESESSNLVVSSLKSLFTPSNSLKERHDGIQNCLMDIDRPIVILIDDVDRLQHDELLMVLKLIRNTADFPNIFYILASDKKVLEQSLSEAGIQDPHAYLKKIINFEMLLPANDNVVVQEMKKEVRILLERYGWHNADEVLRCIFGELKGVEHAFGNMRDLKRFLNSFAFTLEVINKKEANFRDEFYFVDLFGIELIRFLSPELYKVLRDHDEWIFKIDNELLLIKANLKTPAMYQEDKHVKEVLDNATQGLRLKENTEIDPTQYKPAKNILKEIVWDENERAFLLLRSLFRGNLIPRGNLGRTGNDICFPNSYFRYFAFDLKSTQLLGSQVINMLGMSEDNFRKSVKTVVANNQDDSFMHRLRHIGSFMHDLDIEKANYILCAFMLIEEQCRTKKDDIIKSTEYYFEKYHIPMLISTLYGNNHEEDNFYGIRRILKKSRSFCLSTLFMEQIKKIVQYYRESETGTNSAFKNYQSWIQSLFDRFIEERIDIPDAPTDDVTLVMLSKMKSLANIIWAEKFAEYLNTVGPDRYMDWFVHLVRIKNDVLFWDAEYYRSVADWDLILSPKSIFYNRVQQDSRLMNLVDLLREYPKTIEISSFEIKRPFIQYAIDYYRKKRE